MSAEMIRGDGSHQDDAHPHRVHLGSKFHQDTVQAIRRWMRTTEPKGTFIVRLQRTPEYRVVYGFSDYATAFAFKIRFL